jgi:hypothetical protein
VSQFVKAQYRAGFFIANLTLAIYSGFMLEFHYPDGDDSPHADLPIAEGVTVDAHWGNTSIFTHRYLYREVDHIFWGTESVEELELEDEEIAIEGLFLFRYRVPEFDDIAFDLLGADYTHIHQPTPSQLDIAVYDRQILA